MKCLAIDGGNPAIKSLKPFYTIGKDEIAAAIAVLERGPLSGFLGGNKEGGRNVRILEERFCEIFNVKHAISCNSATSGLLIACMATGVNSKSQVIVPCYTMSATAAVPAFLGAELKFGDIDEGTFNLNHFPITRPHTVIVTNLFGHPAGLDDMRLTCNEQGAYMIEDNAQAIMAMEGSKYAGTIGHIGVFSFNVHKHLQCGEGGVCVTNDDRLAHNMRMARNHGELAGGHPGLNLRMTELEAAVAIAQLERRKEIVESRIELANNISSIVAQYAPGIEIPTIKENYIHSFYCWAGKIKYDRKWYVAALQAEGLPITAGYMKPLYHLNAFKKFASPTPIADKVESEIVLIETCAIDPSKTQFRAIREAFEKVGSAYVKMQRRRSLDELTEEGEKLRLY